MNTPEDPIDALLREQNAYLDDAGFTARVIKKLPRRRSVWLRPVILLSAVGIGSVLALRWLPLNHLPPFDPSTLLSADASVLVPWATVLIVAASLFLGAISAFERED